MNRLYKLAQSTVYIQRALQIQSSSSSSSLSNFFQLRTFNCNFNNKLQQKLPDVEKQDQNTIAKQKSKQKLSTKITLISQNQSISVTSLDEAQKLAKRRDLHLQLVQELDPKTQRPVYKLVTPAELLAEELQDFKNDGKTTVGKNNANKKSEKSLTIGSRISDHDLLSRQKNICKWLAKQHEVRILIQGSPDELPKVERIYKVIEKTVKEPEIIGKIQRKQAKGSHIKFNIVPLVPTLSVNTSETNEKTNIVTPSSSSSSPSSSSSS